LPVGCVVPAFLFARMAIAIPETMAVAPHFASVAIAAILVSVVIKVPGADEGHQAAKSYGCGSKANEESVPSFHYGSDY
jgi:hypothetical protein